MSSSGNFDAFEKESQAKLDDIEANLKEKVTVAIIGKVSAGKSSLLNALFNREQKDPLATVGAVAGVTTKVKEFSLRNKVIILDSPGLDDIIKENSAATQQALINGIDVGILVVSDAVDSAQKQHYLALKEQCKKVFVVLNKIDMYDRQKSSIPKVVQQWSDALGLGEDEAIFQTCAFGYDPDCDEGTPLDVRGVAELRDAMFEFLKKHGKDLILAREMEKNSVIARRIIYGALAAVAAEAFIPGSALYITGTQAAAIMSIHYIYTGEVLSKKSAIALIPLFASQSIGSNVFLAVKSLLPPTGILDIAAAVVAVTVTLAMLSAVNWVYENGYNLNDKSNLKEQFNKFYKLLEQIGIKDIILDILKNKNMGAIKKVIEQLVK